MGPTPTPADFEERLRTLYAHLLAGRGLSYPDAARVAGQMVDAAVERSKAAGTYETPLDAGDRLLSAVTSDAGARAKLAELRADHVTDDDIRGWWNQHDVERQIQIVDDDITRMGTATMLLKRGVPPEEVAARGRTSWPRYGRPVDDKWGSGDHRPLPLELKARVNEWTSRMAVEGTGASLQGDMQRAGSMNALVRQLVRAGKI